MMAEQIEVTRRELGEGELTKLLHTGTPGGSATNSLKDDREPARSGGLGIDGQRIRPRDRQRRAQRSAARAREACGERAPSGFLTSNDTEQHGLGPTVTPVARTVTR